MSARSRKFTNEFKVEAAHRELKGLASPRLVDLI